MSTILAIDPGCIYSGWCVIDADDRAPLNFGKIDNYTLRGWLLDGSVTADVAAVEMIASYGMAVGQEVFETCVWIGRFIEASGCGLAPVYRRDVKLHHCGSARAKDANITQALIDRFASGQPNRGKGTKAEPGYFYGSKADIWQAYALAVYAADTATTAQEIA